jgi:alpha-maltose-1-phosphate synthase
MSILLCHPTGNANVRAAAEAFEAAGWLQAFHTGLGWPAAHWLPAPLQRRAFRLPLRRLRLHPRLELARLLASRAGCTQLSRHEIGPLSVDQVYHQVDAAVARALRRVVSHPAAPSLVYAYEDGALATFETAERLGLTRVYELPIGYWRYARRLFRAEAERRPDWAPTLDGLADSHTKLARKDAELALAEQIVVPSQFVRSTLADCPTCSQAAVEVLPYGCPPPVDRQPHRTPHEPLRVLYVGGLSQRKGLADLFDAALLLGSAIQLTVIGRRVGGSCVPLDRALSQHRWLPSLPHSAVLAEMGRHDVLVLPSLFEGLPLVIGEALAQGLPVIATPNAAAEELIVDGREGFVVPIRSPERIAECLERLASDRDLLATMALAAQQRASSWSWQHYGTRLCQLIAPLLAQDGSEVSWSYTARHSGS